MTEEINEDNCVLDYNEMATIWAECLPKRGRNEANKRFNIIFLKINKLNELAKEKQNERG